MKWVRVESRALAAVAYEHDLQHLYLEFRSGGVYRYFDVPLKRHEELLAADSKGQYFRRQILGRFPYERIHWAFRTAS